MKKIVKKIIMAVVIVFVVVSIVFNAMKPMPVSTTEMIPQNANMYFTEQGQVVAPHIVDVYSVEQGQIESINVEEGQQVVAGDVICVIDSSAYEYQMEQMENDIEGYGAQKSNLSTQQQKEKDQLITQKKELESQRDSLDEQQQSGSVSKDEQILLQQEIVTQAEKDLLWAQDNLDRTKKLYEEGVIPKKDYDEAVKTEQNASSALEQANTQLTAVTTSDYQNSQEYYDSTMESINTQIADIDKRINKDYTGSMGQYYDTLAQNSQVNIDQLQKKIDDCTVKAPIGGVVTELPIKDTTVISSVEPIATIRGQGQESVEVFVSTLDIDLVEEGKEVELILKRRDEDKTLTGKVVEIGDKAIDQTSALGVQEKAVKVTVKPDELDQLKTGYDVDVKFTYYNEDNKLVVPNTALFKVEDKDMVFVVQNNKAMMAEVQKGVELNAETVIESGLNEGDIVISDANIEGLSEGSRVSSE